MKEQPKLTLIQGKKEERESGLGYLDLLALAIIWTAYVTMIYLDFQYKDPQHRLTIVSLYNSIPIVVLSFIILCIPRNRAKINKQIPENAWRNYLGIQEVIALAIIWSAITVVIWLDFSAAATKPNYFPILTLSTTTLGYFLSKRILRTNWCFYYIVHDRESNMRI